MIEMHVVKRHEDGSHETVATIYAEAVPSVGHSINVPGLYSAKVLDVEWFAFRTSFMYNGAIREGTVVEPTIIVRG